MGFLLFRGRLKRWQFWLGILALVALFVAAELVSWRLEGPVKGWFVASVLVASAYFAVVLGAGRARDGGNSQWYALLLLVPLIGLLALFILGCSATDDNDPTLAVVVVELDGDGSEGGSGDSPNGPVPEDIGQFEQSGSSADAGAEAF